MLIKILSGIAGVLLFVAYYGPIVFKLKDVPLTVVVLGGIVLTVIDAWESLGNSSG